MPGLVPGIHVFLLQGIKRWMVGTSPGHDGNDRSPTLVESHLMDSLEIPAGSAAPALTSVIHSQPPRIWKFWGTALWGLFILRRGGPIDIAAAVHVVGGGLTISLSVIMGLPAVLAALWIAIRISRTPFADYLALRWPSWTDLLIGVVALSVLVMGWDLLSRAAGREIAPGFMGEVLNSARADGSLWLLVIAFVVAAPISEEFFARGFLYRGWSESFLGPPGAIMLSSLVWTALHLQYDWLILGEVFSIGLLLGSLRYRFNSTWLTVIVHGLNNLAVVIQIILIAGQS